MLKEAGFAVKGRGLGEVYQGRGNLILLKVKGFMVLGVSPCLWCFEKAKTRNLVKKTRDTKGTFRAKMGSIKDRNGMDLTEEDIKKRWQEYTELYKKDLHDPVNYDGVITHLEPDNLECEVKWAK